jgi:hypothetical protein
LRESDEGALSSGDRGAAALSTRKASQEDRTGRRGKARSRSPPARCRSDVAKRTMRASQDALDGRWRRTSGAAPARGAGRDDQSRRRRPGRFARSRPGQREGLVVPRRAANGQAVA